MKVTLFDLLALVGCMVFSIIIFALAAEHADLIVAGIATVVAVFAYIAIASLIYGALRWRPLFLPRCPSCGKRTEFRILAGARDVEHLECTSCSNEFLAIYSANAAIPANSNGLPQTRLSWPRFIGRWVVDSPKQTT